MERAAQIYRNIVSRANVAVPLKMGSIQAAMLDASVDCIKMISTEGIVLHMNRTGRQALGVPEDSTFGMPWLPLLHSSVHETGGKALREAANGSTARFPGQSGSGEETRYWDNLLTPVAEGDGRVSMILCVSRDVTEKTILERELEQAMRRENLLAREMHHRVKNMFAVVSGLVSLAEREASAGAGRETATSILRAKLAAMGRASDATFINDHERSGRGAINVSVLASAVLEPYGTSCSIGGAATAICQKHETALVLFFHEMATNSVKYGALSAPGGHVDVRVEEPVGEVVVVWSESGGPTITAPPKSTGFGGKMLERLASGAGGAIERHWQPQGLTATLRLPRE